MSKSSIVAASKETERRVARAYPGGQRLSAGTWIGEGDIDVISDQYAIQVKHGYGLAAYIKEGIRQAQEGAADVEEVNRLAGQSRYTSGRFAPDTDALRQPILVIVTKPGSGRPARMFEVKEIFDDETK